MPDSIKEAAAKSLWKFYSEQYKEFKRSFGGKLAVLTAVLLLQGQTPTGDEIKPTQAQKESAVKLLQEEGVIDSAEPRLTGQATHKYSQKYINENVKPILKRLREQYATDPDTLDRRVSLYAKAEREARWQEHLDEVDGFKQKGVKLVICSEHADCSERCRPWQGRVYSLDGTSGVTDDGRKFVPLETATNVEYTTKAGKTYYNGLFGFNCRHYLVEYKSGYKFPKSSEAAREKEYKITLEQRQLEREVRRWKTKAIEDKGLDPQGYKEARANAIEANRRYKAFCEANGRAYYPSRTKII